MPQRISSRRVNTESVQGTDSYVEIKAVKMGTLRKFADAPEGADQMQMSLELIKDHVVGWNWVNDDGSPLPLPLEDESVLNELTAAEVATLSEAMLDMSQLDTKKKNVTP